MKIAVCTTYYNPCCWATKKENYDLFSRALVNQGGDLWVATTETEDVFPDQDGVNIVRVEQGERFLWQKEKLLNLILRQLPAEYTGIVWTDCDVLYDSQTWLEDLSPLLEEHQIVQCFEIAFWLNEHFVPASWQKYARPDKLPAIFRPSLAKWYYDNQTFQLRWSHPGLAWAARREVIQQIGGFYDCNIVGGGDTVMSAGFFGETSKKTGLLEEQEDQWISNTHNIVQGDVGWLPIQVRHLWHGSRDSRKYNERYNVLIHYGFNPEHHLVENESGLWEWSDAASDDLKQYTQAYFKHRQEDSLVFRNRLYKRHTK